MQRKSPGGGRGGLEEKRGKGRKEIYGAWRGFSPAGNKSATQAGSFTIRGLDSLRMNVWDGWSSVFFLGEFVLWCPGAARVVCSTPLLLSVK